MSIGCLINPYQQWTTISTLVSGWNLLCLGTTIYINYICAKANKVLGLIRRTFGSHNPEGGPEGVSTAYKTLLRPILEYGCQVWNPSLLSEAHQKHRVSTEVSYPSHLRIRERISGETWGLEMAFARVTKEVYLLSADVKDYFRAL